MTQTREKWESLVLTFEWYGDAMVFHVLIFIFLEQTGRKDNSIRL